MWIYKNQNGKLNCFEGGLDDLDGAIWVDIDRPDNAVIDQLNEAMNLSIPHLNALEMGINIPRFEVVDAMNIFTPRLPVIENGRYVTKEVVFVAGEEALISLRGNEPEVFTEFRQRVRGGKIHAIEHPADMFFHLMSELSVNFGCKVEDMADDLNTVSNEVFTEDLHGHNSVKHKKQIDRIARVEDINSKLMSSLIGLSLISDFLDNLKSDQLLADRRRFEANIESLIESCNFISDRIDFVLNAVLSVINLEQNRVMNVFSVFTVIFTIPAVLVGLWGMNFTNMPELSWHWGYFIALIVIALSGLVPYWFVRKMGWI